MADALTPLLLDAKKEYSIRLCEIMSPLVLKFIDTTFRKAHENVGSRDSLIAFQEQLRCVPEWNSTIIRNHTQAIETKYSYFSDLIAAVFVTHVKVLSSIKLSSQRPNIKLKLPTNEAFVHQVYISTAKNFYENPYAAQNRDRSFRIQLISSAIESAVRAMLPMGDVLQAYLASAVNNDHTVNPVLSPAQSGDENDSESDGDDNSTSSSFEEEADEEQGEQGGPDKIVMFDQEPAPTHLPQAQAHDSLGIAYHSPTAAPPPPPPPPPQIQPLPTPPLPAPPLPAPALSAPAHQQPYIQQAQQQQQPIMKEPFFADASDGEHQFR
jgi:hypothetical protein